MYIIVLLAPCVRLYCTALLDCFWGSDLSRIAAARRCLLSLYSNIRKVAAADGEFFQLQDLLQALPCKRSCVMCWREHSMRIQKVGAGWVACRWSAVWCMHGASQTQSNSMLPNHTARQWRQQNYTHISFSGAARACACEQPSFVQQNEQTAADEAHVRATTEERCIPEIKPKPSPVLQSAFLHVHANLQRATQNHFARFPRSQIAVSLLCNTVLLCVEQRLQQP